MMYVHVLHELHVMMAQVAVNIIMHDMLYIIVHVSEVEHFYRALEYMYM